MQNENFVNFALYEKASNAPVNSSCAQLTLPRVLTPMYALAFFCLGKFLGVETVELSNPSGWGRK